MRVQMKMYPNGYVALIFMTSTQHFHASKPCYAFISGVRINYETLRSVASHLDGAECSIENRSLHLIFIIIVQTIGLCRNNFYIDGTHSLFILCLETYSTFFFNCYFKKVKN